eukprot:888284-Heterocapsa_arctica.AAC.1
MIKAEVNEEDQELRDVVDDMVLFKEDPTETQAALGIEEDLNRTKARLASIGQVGQAVIDLGITHRAHTRASLNKGKRVGDSAKVARRTQALALAFKDKVTIIKTASQSTAIYGAAVDAFTQWQMNTLRGRFATALWPK